MKETVTIAFSEQAKAVVADVKITIESDGTVSEQELLLRTQNVFEKAQEYSAQKTFEKQR